MTETTQYQYPAMFNQTPVHPSELFDSAEQYGRMQAVLDGDPADQEAFLLDQDQQTDDVFAGQFEKKITYPADIENLGRRIATLRQDVTVHNR